MQKGAVSHEDKGLARVAASNSDGNSLDESMPYSRMHVAHKVL